MNAEDYLSKPQQATENTDSHGSFRQVGKLRLRLLPPLMVNCTPNRELSGVPFTQNVVLA